MHQLVPIGGGVAEKCYKRNMCLIAVQPSAPFVFVMERCESICWFICLKNLCVLAVLADIELRFIRSVSLSERGWKCICKMFHE